VSEARAGATPPRRRAHRTAAVLSPHDSDQLLRAVLSSLPMTLVAYDRAKVCTIAAGRGLDALGMRADTLVGRSIDDIAVDLPELRRSVERALRGESTTSTLHAGDIVLDTYHTPLHDDGGAVIGGLAVAVDVSERHRAAMLHLQDATERRRVEQALRDSLDRLRESDAERQRLFSYLVTAQEEERARIAADVHDDSLQALAAVKMRLEMLTDSLSSEQRRRLQGVESDLDAASQRLRRLLFRLRPSALDHGTLGHALEELLQVTALGRIRARVQDNLASSPLDDAKVVVYRIVQEAVANVLKHAHASSLEISLDEHDGGVLVTVRDDGIGFDYEEARRSQLPGHLGLSTMRERAEIAGGWLSVETAPGRGTVVGFWVPRAAAD
jgi:PAS domain S-box-containing protein